MPSPPNKQMEAKPESFQKEILSIQKAIDKLANRANKLEQLATRNPFEYEIAYQTTHNLLVNLRKIHSDYVSQKITPTAFLGLSDLYINEAEAVLSSKKLGSKSFFNKLGLTGNELKNKLKDCYADIELLHSSLSKVLPAMLRQSSPEDVVDLIAKGHVGLKEALTVFPMNPDVIKACITYAEHAKCSSEIQFANLAIVVTLIDEGDILPAQVLPSVPNAKNIVLAFYTKDPLSIKFLPPSQVVTLVQEGAIKLADALKAFPENEEVIMACYKIDPLSISNASCSKVIELIGAVDPRDAIKAFPSNPEMIKRMLDVTQFIESEQEFIKWINTEKCDANAVVKLYPKNAAIIEAIYKQDPLAIKYADIETLNRLGKAGIIKIADVLKAFSKTMPTEDEKLSTATRFTSAMDSQNWPEVAEICSKFWFEKPEGATEEAVTQRLTADNQWSDTWKQLYKFKEAYKKEDYRLTYGPLPKKKETYQLEELARKLMKSGKFIIENVEGDDHFVFKDGTRFNWTQIRKNADLQHVTLAQSDFDLYKSYMESGNKETCELNPYSADYYRSQIYGYNVPAEGAMRYEEMQALNIYTGDFYTYMNGLMRDDKKAYNYRSGSKQTTRDALVHSVMAASGLNNAPLTTINASYRGIGYSTEEHQQRLEAAAKKGVIELNGFVSSSISSDSSYCTNINSIQYNFTNLRGAYIAPISQWDDEEEFLIPPTQIQVSGYNGRGSFNASLVSEIGLTQENTFKPITIDLSDMGLQFADPNVVAQLVTSGDIVPARAIHYFPNNKEVALASYNKDPSSIAGAAKSVLLELEAAKEHSSAATPPDVINFKLFKIQNSYQSTGQPNEQFIKELFKAVGAASPEIDALIGRIKSDEKLCSSFGIDYSKSEAEKISDIRDLMQNASADKPLYPDQAPSMASP